MSTRKIDLPNKINFKPEDKGKKALVEIEPCYPGYGITLGNALRRVLLSSLSGAAVTAVKIKGVQHEFMAMPNVKEDVLDIILNLKQLRLKMFSDDPIRLEIKEKGEKKVTAKDIKATSDVEIVSKDLHIATLTDEKADFNMEIFVDKGIGYVPTEARDKEKLETGTIAIDTLYSPVQNVSIKIENVRVGQMTNYDKLILDITTDGTITAEEAFYQAVDILMDHFNFLQNSGQATEAEIQSEAVSREAAVEKSVTATEEKAEDKSDTIDAEPTPKKRGRPRKIK